MELLRADENAEAAEYAVPKPKGRFCDECRAFVTVLGRTEGVFCASSSCPFPKLNWGGVTGGQAEQTPPHAVRRVQQEASLLSADHRRPDVPAVPGGAGKGAAVGERGPSAEAAVATAAARQVTA